MFVIVCATVSAPCLLLFRLELSGGKTILALKYSFLYLALLHVHCSHHCAMVKTLLRSTSVYKNLFTSLGEDILLTVYWFRCTVHMRIGDVAQLKPSVSRRCIFKMGRINDSTKTVVNSIQQYCTCSITVLHSTIIAAEF